MRINQVDSDRGVKPLQSVAVRKGASSSADVVTNDEAVVHDPTTSVLSELKVRLNALPDIREQLVTEATAKLASGVYGTEEAVQMTAGEIINSLLTG